MISDKGPVSCQGDPAFFFGANVDIQIQVKGIDELVRNLRDLGVNRIPNYVARALTDIADQAQEAMIGNARSMLTVRGSWLTKGTKHGINRKAATKSDLTAVVSTTAPWLIEQETKTLLTPRKASALAMPRIWQRGSRLAVTKSPRYLQNTIKLKSKFGNEIIYQRQGKGRLSNLVPLFILRKQTPEPQRIHLVDTATETINKVSGPVMAGMIQQAIAENL
ncbi:MAG: hypothetical protein IH588_12650 [Anaerolineales bacterium]|nr:hypothetical protein [Anaerolineales bacterium]